MPILKILLLGPPEIRWENYITTIPRRMPRTLLFYLAARRTLASRDEIIALFWDEPTLPAAARLRLNENLSRLRAVLPDPDIFITEGDLIGLNLERIQVDLVTFENLISQAAYTAWQIPSNKSLPQHIVDALQNALDLWRGPHFLGGGDLVSTPGFDEWLTTTASHYQQLRSSVLERLVDHTYVIGDIEGTLRTARMALATDELNENLHFRLMQSLIDKGHLNEARQHFRAFAALMESELQVAPPAKLVSLHEQIQKLHDGFSLFSQPKWEIHTSIKVPFVGREHSMRQIQRAHSLKKSVVVLGEAGAGKTRLIQEFISLLQPGYRSLVATCRPLETALPLQPLCEIFRRHVVPEEWLTLSPVWASQLVSLLPELQTLRPELETPSHPENPLQAQATLLEAIRQVFILLDQYHEIILILDDAHWGDEATLAAISYLHSRPPFNTTALLVILARQEELTYPLENLLVTVGRSKHGEIIHLPQLRSEDIAKLVRFIFTQTPSPIFVDHIMKGTGGNSLFVLETLSSLLENYPEPDLSGNTTIPLTENILNLIQVRINQLDSETKRVLEKAAVIGSKFDLNILMRVTELSDLAVVRALENLEKRLILHPALPANGQTYYHFNHNKFQEALLTGISPAKKLLVHGMIAEFLETHYQPGQAAILAHHFQGAGRLPQAFEYWIEAGNHAREIFSISAADHCYSQAEKIILDIESELPDGAIYRLYAPWCEMSYETQDTQQVRKLGEDLLEIGRQRQSPLLIGTAYDVLSDAYLTENKFEEGLEFATRAIPYLEQSGNTFEHMEAYIHRGVFLYMENELEDAITAFEKALALGEGMHNPEVIQARSNAHYQISLLRTLAGWPKQAQEHAVLSLEDATTSHRTYLKIAAYFVLVLSDYYLGNFHSAHKNAVTGIDLAERTQGWRMLGYLYGYAAATDLTLGKIDSALTQAQKTIQLGEKYGLNDVIAMGCRHTGDVYTLLKAPDKAIPYYERGVDTAGNHFLGVDNLIRLGFVRCISGLHEMGHQTLAFALAMTQNNKFGLGSIIIEFFQSLAYLAEKKWDQAAGLANKVKEETNIRCLPSYHLASINTLGKLAPESDYPNLDIDQIQNVAKQARLAGNIWVELDSQTILYKMYRQMGIHDPLPAKRIDEIMEHLRVNTQGESLQQVFQVFERLIMPSRS